MRQAGKATPMLDLFFKNTALKGRLWENSHGSKLTLIYSVCH